MVMDVQLLALIVVAALLVLQWRHWQSRFQETERRLAELTEVKEDLQRLLAKQAAAAQEKAAEKDTAEPNAAAAETAAAPAETEGEKAPAETVPPVRYPAVPVGTRHLAVVAPKPMVAVPAPQVPVPAAQGLSPEIAAVIMAAVAAYGYAPAAVRSIRRRPARSSRWVLAGRLAGMR